MKRFLLFINLLITVSVNGQGNNEFDNSLQKQFSIGWSNPISFVANINDVNNEKIGIYFDFIAETSASNFLRSHIKFHPSKTPYTLEMNDF